MGLGLQLVLGLECVGLVLECLGLEALSLESRSGRLSRPCSPEGACGTVKVTCF